MDQTKCKCGGDLNWSDMTECQYCEELKCADCFTMDEDAEVCDECAKRYMPDSVQEQEKS